MKNKQKVDLERFESCPECGSNDIHFCSISVRPYCGECKHWGSVNHGTVDDAVRAWNDGARAKRRALQRSLQRSFNIFFLDGPNAKQLIAHYERPGPVFEVRKISVINHNYELMKKTNPVELAKDIETVTYHVAEIFDDPMRGAYYLATTSKASCNALKNDANLAVCALCRVGAE